jgi:hypothetical protein
VSISVTYTAVLDVKRSTAEHLARLLRDHRIAARTRKGRRALGCFKQAVLVLRWFLDGTRLAQLARDTAYRHPPPTATSTKDWPSWPPAHRTSRPRWSVRRQPG